jgi:hypothetical protein
MATDKFGDLRSSATDHDFWSGLTDAFHHLKDLTLRDPMHWPHSLTALPRCSQLPNLLSLASTRHNSSYINKYYGPPSIVGTM